MVVNDNFIDSIDILWAGTGSTTVYGTNTGATGEVNEPDHAGVSFFDEPDYAESVWWTWTASTSGPVRIDTFGSNYDTTLAVYIGDSIDSLTEVASNDDSSSLQSRVVFNAVAGQTYRIAVDGYAGSDGDIQLNLREVIPPVNDNFSNSIILEGTDITAFGSNTGATGEVGEPDHAGVSFFDDPDYAESVWWTWTASTSGPVRIDTFGSNYDTTLAVYIGDSIDSLTEVASNDDSSSLQSRVVFNAVAGQTYRIAVDGYAGSDGDIQLNLREVIPPVNDNFSNSIILEGTDITAFGSNTGATGEVGEPDHAGVSFFDDPDYAESVWWTWTAPVSGRFRIDTFGSNYDATFAVYTGDDVSNLSLITSGESWNDRNFNAVAGQTYRIAVDGFGGSDGDIQLNLRELIPPVNDNFSNSTILEGINITAFGSNTGATGEVGEPDHAGVSFFDDPDYAESVWWTWTAPENALVRIDTFGSNYDTTLAVYTGNSVNNLTEIESNDQYLGDQSAVFISAQAGQTYRIAVDGYYGSDGDIILNLTEVILPQEVGGKNLVSPDLPSQARAQERSHAFFPDTSRVAYDPDSVPRGANRLRPNVFSTRSNANVFNSTEVPWTSVNGRIGDNSVDPLTGVDRALWPENDIDFYQISARAGQKLTLDIDNGIGGNGSVDTMVWVFDSNNRLLASNDDFYFDSEPSGNDPGSTSSLDSYLEYDVQRNGQHYIAVSAYGNFWDGNSWTNFAYSSGNYTLNVSLG